VLVRRSLPSPTIATDKPRPCSSATLHLFLGQDFGHDFVDAERVTDALCDLLCVTRNEDDAAAHAAQCCNGLSGFGSDRILQRQCTDDAPLFDEIEHCGTALLPFIDPRSYGFWFVDVSLAQ
jgi:hypothetical protein